MYEQPIESKRAALAPISLSKPLEKPPEPEEKGRAVFGLSKNTLMEKSTEMEARPGVEIKKGNTLAIAPDDQELQPGDPEALPIPTDQYLVTQMPVLAEEVRIPYPPEAREKGIQGPVVMNVLIDPEGIVRQVKLIEGPGGTLDVAALEAVKRLRFRPARVKERSVAVRIRYTYRFVLEP